jgi:predicted Ser/Thr protein kinase
LESELSETALGVEAGSSSNSIEVSTSLLREPIMSPFDDRQEDSLALNRQVDALCDRFEEAWRNGEQPEFRAWVPAAGPLRRAALVELACIDLEWRIGAGEPARIEEVADAFPELHGDPRGLLRLVAAEARLRLGREPGLDAEDFRRRFPDLVELSGWDSAVAEQVEANSDRISGELTTDAQPAGTDAAAEAIGERLRLHAEIGRGGMGVVLLGRDDALGRDVAVKVLLEKHAAKPERVRRFLVEAQITGQLQHPGIVPVHDIGHLLDGRPYFTMKLIHGRTLMDLLAERTDPQQDRPRFLKAFEQICQALAYAHSRGVIHRDLKPSNVMVGAFSEVQVMDWGLAKILASGVSTPRARRRRRDDSAEPWRIRGGISSGRIVRHADVHVAGASGGKWSSRTSAATSSAWAPSCASSSPASRPTRVLSEARS